jgi:cobalt-zinc-cadmium efflux system outer membrane protein
MWNRVSRRLTVVGPALLIALAACQTYTARPLDPESVLRDVAARRRSVEEGEVVTLARATEILLEHGPRVREARGAYLSARAFADVATPLPNPSLEAGPKYVTRGEEKGRDRWGGEGGLGWAILLGGRRGLTDERNALAAEAAHVEAVGVERTEYLALRRELVALAFASRETRVREELFATAETSAGTVRRLIDAGQATALDLTQVRLEALEAETALLEAREAEDEARAALAARTGVWSGAFRTGEPPPVDAQLPSEQELRRVLLRDHPGLASLREAYRLTEKDLQLEIAAQWPDLEITLELEAEAESDVWGLPIGIEIPLFDRNQPGIAAARGAREEARVAYEAEASRALASIEAARRRVRSRGARLEILRTRSAPAAKEALDLARRSLEAGAADALQFLEVLRAEREARLATLEAEHSLYEAWFDLEEACGAPLLAFPDEPREMKP